jgi:uncharacterized protein
MSQSNRETVEHGYAALNRGDLEAVLALLDEDFSWSEGERSLGAGDHYGRESFAEFLESWLEAFDDFHIELIDVIEEGDEIVAVGKQSGRGRASGLPVEVEVVHLWTVRDERAARFRSFPRRELALAVVSTTG